MKFTATKSFDLYPIGDISFVFNNKSRRKGKRINVREVHILTETQMTIDAEIEKELMKVMKEKGSDLLTDGRDFYTTFGGNIKQIRHPQFDKELEMHKELNT